MSVIAQLRSALKPMNIDIAQDRYAGDAGRWITYNVVTESPSSYADDAPKEETTYLQVHLYVQGAENGGKKPVNYIPLQKRLRKLLFEAGFSYPIVALNIVEEDTKMRHICLETNIDTEVEE